MEKNALFTFEISILSVKKLNTQSSLSSVGFRLFDFPLVLIDYVDNQCKGKSCTFKMKLSKLKQLMSERPLFILLIDSNKKETSIIGSCCLPLIQMLADLDKIQSALGTEIAAATSQSGCYHLISLNQQLVGKITLNFKLSYFGPHVSKTYSKKYVVNNQSVHDKDKKSKFDSQNNCVSSDKDCIKLLGIKKPVSLNIKYDNFTIPCFSQHNKLELHPEICEIDNIICPPTLCLNSKNKPITNLQKQPTISEQNENALSEADEACSFNNEDKLMEYEILNNNITRNDCTTQTSDLLQKYVNDKNVAMNLQNMPILSALLEEFQEFNSIKSSSQRICDCQAKEKSVQILKTNNNDKPSTTTVKKKIQKKRQPTSFKTKLSEKHLNCNQVKSNKNSVANGNNALNQSKPNVKSERKGQKTSKNLPMYGLTRTQKLRYNLTHKGKTLADHGSGESKSKNKNLDDESEIVRLAKSIVNKGVAQKEEQEINHHKLVKVEGQSGRYAGIKLDVFLPFSNNNNQEYDEPVGPDSKSTSYELNDFEEPSIDDSLDLSNNDASKCDLLKENNPGFFQVPAVQKITDSQLGDDTTVWVDSLDVLKNLSTDNSSASLERSPRIISQKSERSEKRLHQNISDRSRHISDKGENSTIERSPQKSTKSESQTHSCNKTINTAADTTKKSYDTDASFHSISSRSSRNSKTSSKKSKSSESSSSSSR